RHPRRRVRLGVHRLAQVELVGGREGRHARGAQDRRPHNQPRQGPTRRFTPPRMPQVQPRKREGEGRMNHYYQDERVTLFGGDALATLAELPSASIDAVVTDPPYSSGGMVRGDRTQTDVKAKYSGSYGKQPDHADFTGDSRDQ